MSAHVLFPQNKSFATEPERIVYADPFKSSNGRNPRRSQSVAWDAQILLLARAVGFDCGRHKNDHSRHNPPDAAGMIFPGDRRQQHGTGQKSQEVGYQYLISPLSAFGSLCISKSTRLFRGKVFFLRLLLRAPLQAWPICSVDSLDNPLLVPGQTHVVIRLGLRPGLAQG